VTLPVPNVPNLPGVPQLPGYVSRTLALATEAINTNLWQASQSPAAWGIFNYSGDQVVDPDSVIDFNNRNEWQVSSFPVQAKTASQASGFQSFNKVVVPYETMVTMRKSGTLTDRQNFLASIASIAGDTNIYLIFTPEAPYSGNITRYEIARRGAPYASLIEVDVYFIAINQTATATYSNTTANTSNASDPTALPATNKGFIQPAPISQQSQAALGALNLSLF
jgi:hypothetical protein